MSRCNRGATTAVLLALATVAACGGNSQAGAGAAADEEADRLCRGPGLDYALAHDSGSELVASHAATAGELQSWERDRNKADGPVPDAELRAASSDSFVALCKYEGDYTSFPKRPPTADASASDPYRYLSVTVTDDPTDSHPLAEVGEPEPVLLVSVSSSFDPEHPPAPDEDPS